MFYKYHMGNCLFDVDSMERLEIGNKVARKRIEKMGSKLKKKPELADYEIIKVR